MTNSRELSLLPVTQHATALIYIWSVAGGLRERRLHNHRVTEPHFMLIYGIPRLIYVNSSLSVNSDGCRVVGRCSRFDTGVVLYLM